MNTDITNKTAKELATGYRAKEFSATDVIRAHIERIEKENPRLNAYLEVFDDVLESVERPLEVVDAEAGDDVGGDAAGRELPVEVIPPGAEVRRRSEGALSGELVQVVLDREREHLP